MGFASRRMEVTLVRFPPTLMPRGIEKMGVARVKYDLANLKDADVVYMLPMDGERVEAGSAYLPSLREYAQLWGICHKQPVHDKQLVMHPGPINQGAEITTDITEAARPRT